MPKIDELTAAFGQVAKDHHDAFSAVDGVDPDWALWYAERLKPSFDTLLDAELSKSEIVALLLSLAQEHEARGASTPWARFYAELTAERFVGAAEETLSLYQFPSCPYCRAVLREIEALGAPIELRDIFAESKWRDELVAARGRGTVPVLRCERKDGTVRWMPESRDIIKYLRKRFG